MKRYGEGVGSAEFLVTVAEISATCLIYRNYGSGADAKIKTAKIKTKGILVFSRRFAPAKISCYTVTIIVR